MNKYIALLLLSIMSPLHAGKADVIDVRVSCNSSCTFHVTVKHADSGWEHYANEWVVKTESGETLGTRVLYHPHVNEQPFTRSLNAVKIPSDVRQVIVKARDSVHGYGGLEQKVTLPDH